MAASDAKADLSRYLQVARDALLWKLEGLSEYDIRRPLTPTGTNLLGVVKHVASVEAGYLGDCFGFPFGEAFPWFEEDAEPNDDFWATAEESRDDIVGLYRRVWANSDKTIAALPEIEVQAVLSDARFGHLRDRHVDVLCLWIAKNHEVDVLSSNLVAKSVAPEGVHRFEVVAVDNYGTNFQGDLLPAPMSFRDGSGLIL